LPAEIGNLSNLQTLSLYNNQLISLPAEIGNLSNLQTLSLYNNQLISLPPEIGNLSNLQWLNLAYNQLSSLPAEIGNLSNLCTLDLRENLFETVPTELAPLKRLGNLESCPDYSYSLRLDDSLLDTLPDTVVAGGTTAILDYLENEAWWHLQRLIGGTALGIGVLAAGILGLRWRNLSGKRKRKNEEKSHA
jgi:hypothetical protein